MVPFKLNGCINMNEIEYPNQIKLQNLGLFSFNQLDLSSNTALGSFEIYSSVSKLMLGKKTRVTKLKTEDH